MQDRIEKRVELNASVERVWRALTDHQEFGAWFQVNLESPFRIGEVTRGQVTYEGYEHLEWEATVQAMEPKTYFSFSWSPGSGDPEDVDSEEPETLVEFKLEATSSGTSLIVSESGFSAIADGKRREEAFLRNSDGWAIQIANIAAYVES